MESVLIKDVNTFEAVQRRFTKRMKHLTYYQRFSKLKLEINNKYCY